MHPQEKLFQEDSRIKATDMEHRRKINYSLTQSDIAFRKGKTLFPDLESVRKIAKNIKWETIEHLDKYLLEFERNFTGRGGKVIWAENPQQALDAVLQICTRKQAKSVVKSKSMVTEEIHLNSFLSAHG
ncbi:MAG TPA: [Fe-S]-binding protein, partial [Agriterribacter sp.]|nr:[Fe-S]-binding protein [Agriterribacter sp.]